MGSNLYRSWGGFFMVKKRLRAIHAVTASQSDMTGKSVVWLYPEGTKLPHNPADRVAGMRTHVSGSLTSPEGTPRSGGVGDLSTRAQFGSKDLHHPVSRFAMFSCEPTGSRALMLTIFWHCDSKHFSLETGQGSAPRATNRQWFWLRMGFQRVRQC